MGQNQFACLERRWLAQPPAEAADGSQLCPHGPVLILHRDLARRWWEGAPVGGTCGAQKLRLGAALGPYELDFDLTLHHALLLTGPICMVLFMRNPSSSPQPKGSWSKSGVSSRSRYLPSAGHTRNLQTHVPPVGVVTPTLHSSHRPLPGVGQVQHSLMGGISEWRAPATSGVTPAPHRL